MNHQHQFTKLVPSGYLELVNLQCSHKNCKEVKTVDALELEEELKKYDQ